MPKSTACTLLQFDAPPDWSRRDAPTCVGFAPDAALDAASGDIRFATLALLISQVLPDDGTPPDLTVEHLMRSRFASGTPDPLAAELAGRPSCAYDWTDGTRDIITHFAMAPSGELVEVSILRAWIPGSADTPLPEVASALLRRLHWLPDSS